MDTLQAVLENINNWFERESYGGPWTVEGGELTRNPGIMEGQYFRIVGSVFNDGLHRWPTLDLVDETFDGEVRALAVPAAVVTLAGEIADWREANAKALASPYSSESFGGYSYTLASGRSGGVNGGAGAWVDHFRTALNAWRKL